MAERALFPALCALEGDARLRAPLRPLVRRAREVFDARLLVVPVEPKDLAREPRVTCGCPSCSAVKAFLVDPTREVWRLRAAQHERTHVESAVAGADVTATTDKRGSPYTLVLTKNLRSYREAVAARAKDLAARERLAWWG